MWAFFIWLKIVFGRMLVDMIKILKIRTAQRTLIRVPRNLINPCRHGRTPLQGWQKFDEKGEKFGIPPF
ncbi:hypothetical protein A3O16_02885 [Ligilactobacillus aviarius]|uniref:Uncharacterized protein n=1 Tax=Ligilactobacillus aviarius TaxID=1606 RepID=A0A179C460_9LACO|nr:hypothetical protein A3O08_05505 [Ligilactobacillus aviarius]OAQ01038.1 hypothetical protein A3O07_01820 [Ligilactobacillus aviarius]OAQ01902.1 hypothetical protein A3O09_01010 [Ligilactobacillus aviarius]OAQ05288.1 hypothetical protein A3O13_04130 [Ligilactobacillus aviarius]OAQ06486.1 hypothetical protein A3O14_01020 [Ligilactobacillus aviarius]